MIVKRAGGYLLCRTPGCQHVAMRHARCSLHYEPNAQGRAYLAGQEVDEYVRTRCPQSWAYLMGETP